ncbi:MAG: MarR family transcriptional regulator [Solirubrobacteraceae bacterium]
MQGEERALVLEAMSELMAERHCGPGELTVTELRERSGASRPLVEQLLDDGEAALLAVFDLGVERVTPKVLEAFAAESRWLDRIKAPLAALLRFVEAEPALGRVLFLLPGGAERALRRRLEVMQALARVLEDGSEAVPGRRAPEPVVAQAVLGAGLAIVQRELLAERPAPIELFGSIVAVIVLPYLGPATARRELARPAPRPRSTTRADPGRPGVRMRLTYRTSRVLEAIGDYPGASNREIAERAGIVDQGQISKLLGRLETRGLIEKLDERRVRGAPNSWRLTVNGEGMLGTP